MTTREEQTIKIRQFLWQTKRELGYLIEDLELDFSTTSTSGSSQYLTAEDCQWFEKQQNSLEALVECVKKAHHAVDH